MQHLVYDRGTKQHGIYEDSLGFVLRWIRNESVIPKLKALGKRPKKRLEQPDLDHLSELPESDETEALIDEGQV